MKKILGLFFLTFILTVTAQECVAGKDYSTLNIICGRGAYGISYSISLYINDNLVTNMNSLDLLQIKLYSKGRLSVTFLYPHDKFSCSIQIDSNKDYYITQLTSPFNLNPMVVEYDKFELMEKKAKLTIGLEENKKKPWGDLDAAQRSEKGQGTCFALTANGYLITNFHVIENAKEVTVKGIDGDYSTKYGATIVASDRANDLALLKIGNKNVKFDNIPYAFRSSGVQQGEKVYAMGFPMAVAMGLEVKLTDGIISAKSGVEGDISKFQISAAVNPGNSGGPLIDEQGNIIGVIYAKSTVAESAGYAVKVSYLETFLKNVDGFEFPSMVNTMKDKPFTDKIAELKKYIFIVETN
jgi:S1-C subfamily serine protease